MTQKLLLKIAIAIACLVPITAGLYGVTQDYPESIDMDSHFRYLSGLLLGIGVAFATTIPKIETHKSRFRLLTAIVFTGGISRLGGVMIYGIPGPYMQFGLIMELIITPLLCFWQHRIARMENL